MTKITHHFGTDDFIESRFKTKPSKDELRLTIYNQIFKIMTENIELALQLIEKKKYSDALAHLERAESEIKELKKLLNRHIKADDELQSIVNGKNDLPPVA